MKPRVQNIFNDDGMLIYSKGNPFQCYFDKEDKDFIAYYHWFIAGKGYATTTIKTPNGNKSIMMHRLLFGLVNPNIQVDHIYFNRLDNRRSHLRICSPEQNQKNRQPKGKSKYMGVNIYEGKRRSYITRIRINGKSTHIGTFHNEIDAAKAYDGIAKIVHGEFANLNFKTVR